jgi:hypothetical protein
MFDSNNMAEGSWLSISFSYKLNQLLLINSNNKFKKYILQILLGLHA